MGIDRAQARSRVKRITGWAAAGAAAMTAAFAFGAAHGTNVAKAPARTASATAATDDAAAQDQGGSASAPEQGFTPPAASTAPPAGMSGGS
jgi:hypothetical protein